MIGRVRAEARRTAPTPPSGLSLIKSSGQRRARRRQGVQAAQLDEPACTRSRRARAIRRHEPGVASRLASSSQRCYSITRSRSATTIRPRQGRCRSQKRRAIAARSAPSAYEMRSCAPRCVPRTKSGRSTCCAAMVDRTAPFVIEVKVKENRLRSPGRGGAALDTGASRHRWRARRRPSESVDGDDRMKTKAKRFSVRGRAEAGQWNRDKVDKPRATLRGARRRNMKSSEGRERRQLSNPRRAVSEERGETASCASASGFDAHHVELRARTPQR